MAMSPAITGQALAMTGFGQTGKGSVDIGESICQGGTFSSVGARTTGNVSSITVFDGPTDMQTFDALAFNR
jgi:hypothetical protein